MAATTPSPNPPMTSCEAALADLNIEVLTTETFGAKDTDFSAQLTKIKSLNPDAIVVSALADAGAGILLAKQALGFPASVRVIGGNGLNSPKVLEIAGAAADGLLVGSPWFVGKTRCRSTKNSSTTIAPNMAPIPTSSPRRPSTL